MKVQITYDDTMWQLVPKEPTPEMLKAGTLTFFGELRNSNEVHRAYNVMLSAAPTPPAKPTRSQQMREKGFTPRNSGFVCDECGEPLASVLQVQVHQCKAPAQPVERKPLTEEQINGLLPKRLLEVDINGMLLLSLEEVWQIARAAHGIKGGS